MANESPAMILKAIGTVRNKVKQPVKHDWQKVISKIVIDSSLTEALDSLDEFSHIVVLYWMHRSPIDGQLPLKTHPMGKLEIPLTGRFATRSPHRPNPVGKTTVRLLQRQGNVLKVKGLDAIDGTPVIDIKPYIPGYDSPTDAQVPSWATKDKPDMNLFP